MNNVVTAGGFNILIKSTGQDLGCIQNLENRRGLSVDRTRIGSTYKKNKN